MEEIGNAYITSLKMGDKTCDRFVVLTNLNKNVNHDWLLQ